MIDIRVDHERLADNLEAGIRSVRHTDAWPVAGRPKRYILRAAGGCGLVATAIQQHIDGMGLTTGLVESRPDFEFEPNINHIVALADTDGPDPLVIDASYSQFLELVGMRWGYELCAKQVVYPPERAVSFRLSEPGSVVDWITQTAVEFQGKNSHPTSRWGDMGKGQLADASADAIRETYARIWDPANFSPWPPPKLVLEAAVAVSRYIDKSAIEIG